MTVDIETAKYKSEYKGQTYYFCAPGCKATFDKNPENYLKSNNDDHGEHTHQACRWLRILTAFIVFLGITMGLFVGKPVLAESHEHCSHEATIAALRDYVNHAAEAGHIDNSGIVKSLLAKLDAAQKAYDKENINAAVNALEAFVNAVEAQTGKHILGEHGTHLIHHAHEVIAEIQ